MVLRTLCAAREWGALLDYSPRLGRASTPPWRGRPVPGVQWGRMSRRNQTGPHLPSQTGASAVAPRRPLYFSQTDPGDAPASRALQQQTSLSCAGGKSLWR